MIPHRLLTKSALLLTLLPLPLLATGDYWTAPSYLDGSGRVLKGTPEFFWHMEVKRLAEKYKDADAPARPPAPAGFAELSGDEAAKVARDYLVKEEEADFSDALKSGRLKPKDPAAAAKANAAARAAINESRAAKIEADNKPADAPAPDNAAPGEKPPTPPAPSPAPAKLELPAEEDSEFADYHKGAALDLADKAAAASWEKLLARPAAERHYRSVWAAYMLGRHALTQKDLPGAAKRFAECRSLAKEGFADSAHLAADSYGWEARAELLQGHYPKAARLYLNQLALGDESAIVSLKRIVPEVGSIYGSGPPGGVPGVEPSDDPNAAPAHEGPGEDENAMTARWLASAKDPVIQQLVTAHILATDTAEYAYVEAPAEGQVTRGEKWLKVLTDAGVEKSEDADRLAWVAYNTGNYKAARAWLEKSDRKSPLSRWLDAKFALREGRFDEAGKVIPDVAAQLPAQEGEYYMVPPHDRAFGEAGALAYSQGDYVRAFELFLKGHADEDLKFLIESILTPEELIALGAKVPRPQPPKKDADGEEIPNTHSEGTWIWRSPEISSWIGRRLVREGKVKEGRGFLTETEQQEMDSYVAAAVKAEDKKVSAPDRAKAWWDAADIMMENGHVFRGTEEDFHRPSSDGDQTSYTVRSQRVSGKFTSESWSEKEPKGPRPVFIPTGEKEKKRLDATAKQHTKETRTRMVAASHLLKAADLLPDKSEEKARTLNTAGYWLQDLDNPMADKIFARLKALSSTPTGKAAAKKRWFTGYTNPWSTDKPSGEEK